MKNLQPPLLRVLLIPFTFLGRRYRKLGRYPLDLMLSLGRRGGVVKGVEQYRHFVSQHLSGAGSSRAGSISRDLNSEKLHSQYLTTSVVVVLVAR